MELVVQPLSMKFPRLFNDSSPERPLGKRPERAVAVRERVVEVSVGQGIFN
jgi:hypothetical protein